MQTCRSCKFEIPDDATVCGYCHHAVHSEKTIKNLQRYFIVMGIIALVFLCIIAVAPK